MAVVKYENIRLRETTRTGKLKQDENGYFDVILGAMNTFNSRGEFYALEGAEEIFTGSSIYHRRITEGKLYGEHGHPKQNELTREQYYRRLLEIREERWGTFIKEVTLDDTLWKKYPRLVSKGAVLIMGKVMPYGEQKQVVADGLSNPDINFAYSVRSFTNNFKTGNHLTKVMTECVTWDSVGSNGVKIAEKYNAPTLESHDEDIDMCDLVTANRTLHLNCGATGVESGAANFDELILRADSLEELTDVTKSGKIWRQL